MSLSPQIHGTSIVFARKKKVLTGGRPLAPTPIDPVGSHSSACLLACLPGLLKCLSVGLDPWDSIHANPLPLAHPFRFPKNELHSHLTYFGTAVQRYGVLSARADKPLTKTHTLLYV